MDTFWKGSLFESLYIDEEDVIEERPDLVLEHGPFPVGSLVIVAGAFYHYIPGGSIGTVTSKHSSTMYEVECDEYSQTILVGHLTAYEAPASTSIDSDPGQGLQVPRFPGAGASTSSGESVQHDIDATIITINNKTPCDCWQCADGTAHEYARKCTVRRCAVCAHPNRHYYQLATTSTADFQRGDDVYITNLGKEEYIWIYKEYGVVDKIYRNGKVIVRLYDLSTGELEPPYNWLLFNSEHLVKI